MALLLTFSLTFFSGTLPEWVEQVGPEHAPHEIARIDAPFDMPQLARPTFPNKIFPITEYGAQPDDDGWDTQPIRAAIEACAAAGGGTVEVPPGTWLTGAIHLQSNVNVHLAEGAVLRFSNRPEDYLPIVFTRWAGFECYNYSPLIYARDCENIAITGKGKLEGNGETWWSWADRQETTAKRMYHEQILQGVPPEQRRFGTPEDGLRPQFIAPINCRNVWLEGFTIASPGPFWTIDVTYCDGVIIRALSIHTVGGPNTDGINIDSSRNVLIEHCFLETGDDCLCMKSGINEDGWRVGRPTENVVIRYNRTGKGHGGAVYGSDTSGWIRNVFVHRCVFDGTDIGIRMKSTRGRGGGVERIWMEDILMRDIVGDVIHINMAYRAWMGTTDGKAPRFADIVLKNIQCNGAARAGEISGLPESPVESVQVQHVTVHAAKGFEIHNIRDAQFEDVQIFPVSAP